MQTEKEKKALDKVVSNLLDAVKLQERRVGYLFWKHNETKKEIEKEEIKWWDKG